MTNKDVNSESFSSLVSSKSIPAIVEKFVIRLPNGLRTQIKELSENNRRSMNSEIIMVLEKHLRESHTVNIEEIQNDAVDVSDEEIKTLELDRKLDSLTLEKKEALLELLG